MRVSDKIKLRFTRWSVGYFEREIAKLEKKLAKARWMLEIAKALIKDSKLPPI